MSFKLGKYKSSDNSMELANSKFYMYIQILVMHVYNIFYLNKAPLVLTHSLGTEQFIVFSTKVPL